MEPYPQKNDFFNDSEILALVSLEGILRRIHERLITQGYIIKDGEIIEPKSVDNKA